MSMKLNKKTEEWEREFDRQLSHYIKDTSIGQYDDKFVNIGFKKAKDVVKDFIRSELEKERQSVAVEIMRFMLTIKKRK